MELFDILNEDGSKSGIQKERSGVHRDGDLHGSIHIWIIREFDGVKKVLLQKRARDKDSYPGFLDAACTGHIDAGEEISDAAVREISEELNLKVDFSDLKFVTQIHVNERNMFHNKVFINNELTSVFVLSENISLDSLKYQESEIDELVWLDIDTVYAELENGCDKNKYCINSEEFKTVVRFYYNTEGQLKMNKKKVAFICIHNSCRSQIAEALGKKLAGDKFEFYSAGTETKPQINQDAVRLMKVLYGIDMEREQYSKTFDKIPTPDIAISMGCDVGCPYIGRNFDESWGLADPTGKSDDEFIKVIKEIECRVSVFSQQN